MKPGVRALGVAESYRSERSTLAGAVVRADRLVDGLSFADCTVGGTDATAAVIDCYGRLDREDVRYLLLAGVAPAWFNVVDLRAVAVATERPVLSVSFEDSPGLGDAIRREFEGAAADRRLETYRDQPPRHRVRVGADGEETPDSEDGSDLWVRAVGPDGADAADHDDLDPAAVLRAYTAAGWGTPEPLRVAKLAARAGDAYRRTLVERGSDGADADRGP